MNLKHVMLIGAMAITTSSIFGTEKDNTIDKKACKYVKEQISLIEKFHNLEEGYSLELVSASNFLQQITQLKSKTGYSYETIGLTKANDLEAWKKWFDENKHLLHWDKETKTVIVQL